MPSSDDDQQSVNAPIDMPRVRRLFDAPERLADSEFLRREVAQRMHERLALVKLAPKLVIDAGCGEGADLSILQNRFPEADMLGVDVSPAMLKCAGSRQSGALSAMNRMLNKWLPETIGRGRHKAAWLANADFAQLPLAAASTDLIWSNLGLHWHMQPERVFAEWRRVLRVEGLLMFSCFGPDTFKELRTAFAAIDGLPHVLPFVDMHDYGDMLVHTGFSTPVMDMETVTVTYRSMEKLLAEVRALGGNPLATRRRGLIGRHAWQRMTQALESQRRSDGSIPLTYEIIYGHAFRPAPRTTASGEAVIRFDRRKP
jgi:malonyl-CoA O-methyltransferase